MTIIPHKTCPQCNRSLPYTKEYFRVCKREKHGLTHACRECLKVRDAKYLDKTRDKNKQRSRDRYYGKPELRKKYHDDNLEKILQGKRDYRKANPDKVKKHKRDSQRRNRDSANIRNKRNRERHPDIMRMRSRVGAMKRRVKVGDFTRAELMDLYHEQNERCAYCGISIYWHIPHDIHVDHIVPVTKGGTNELENLALTCADCNLSKHDLLLADWLLVRGW